MDWLSKIIEKFVDRYFEQKAVPKYLSGIKNLIRANHKEDVKSLSLFAHICMRSSQKCLAIHQKL